MKITKILIRRFGIWQDLHVPLAQNGLTVFYGPNEAGKTTLLQFLRAILYGFKSHDAAASCRFGDPFGRRRHGSRIDWEGSLQFKHHRQVYEIRRTFHGQGRGLLTVTNSTGQTPAEELVGDLLNGTEEKVFDNIFAIGLHELQELATLQNDKVAEHIYAVALGPDGQRLLEVSTDIENEGNRLFDPRQWDSEQQDRGKLYKLFHKFDQLCAEIESVNGLIRQHSELTHERNHNEIMITDLQGRQAGIQAQLRGHLFMEHIWSPWNRVRLCQTEMDKLPIVAEFPKNGLARLDGIEIELSTAVNGRDTLLAEASQFRREAEQITIDPEIQRHAVTMRSFVDQSHWLQQVHERIVTSQRETDELCQQMDDQFESLGPEWSASRLQAVDTTPAAYFRMVSMARNYQSVLARREKLRRRQQRLSRIRQQRLAELNDQLRQFGGVTLDDALTQTRQKLVELEELGALKLRESELEHRRVGLLNQSKRLQARLTLPKWVYAVLGIFAVTGAVLAVLGLVSGLTTNGIAGTIYSLLGITCGGLTWALKTHFEREVQDSIELLQDELRENEIRLREIRTSIEHVTALETITADGSVPVNDAFRLSEAELIKHVTQRLIELEQLTQQQQQIHNLRRRLSNLRSRFQSIQRKIATTRQNWCELLTQSGFTETIHVDEAFEVWQNVVEANEIHRLWTSADTKLQNLRQTYETYRKRIEELGHRMHRWDLDYEHPLNVLLAWEEDLQQYSTQRKDRRYLRREQKARHAEAEKYQTNIDELKTQRSALLVQGGAASRKEFEQRAEWYKQRHEEQQRLYDAKSDLEIAARTEPELAVVEEDLLAYNADSNAECIRTLKQERDDLKQDLQQAFENQGRIRQELTTLESDRLSTQLRFEREQVAAQIKQTVERWLTFELSSRAVEQIRADFERTCQPKTLAAASHYLQRLSNQKYSTLWTPLGKRRLCIDDDQSNTLLVEHLSGGTREQLFLAIRLALVREFTRRGIELPMVLDDVIANFDHLRSEAAANELIDLGEQGQQILFFTCHLHLAHLFESKGFTPIWLTEQGDSHQERRAG